MAGLICFIVLALVGIILGSVLGTRSSSSAPINNQDTCKPRQVPGLIADILWSFDCSNANNDRSNKSQYNGIGINNPSYVKPDYSGQGAALSLDVYSEQHIDIPQHINYTMMSLTVSGWIYLLPTPNVIGQGTILNQCNPSNVVLNCLACGIEKINVLVLYFQLPNNSILSSPSLGLSQWQHFAFIFDITTMTQSIYINGRLDIKVLVVGQINGMDSQTTPNIGPSTKSLLDYYSGKIDQLTFSFRAKNADEVLDEATLLVHYQFNSSAQLYDDSGPNGIPGQGTNVSFDATSNSLLLNTYLSYYQSSGFVLLTSNNSGYSYSFSLWLKILSGASPGVIARIPLVRVSLVTDSTSAQTTHSSDSCLTMLNYDTGYFTIHQYSPDGYYAQQDYNDKIEENNLYHMAVTYNGLNNKLLMYINGSLVNSFNVSSINGLVNAGSRLTLTLGHAADSDALLALCNIFSAGEPFYHFITFNGTMDDVRLYSRVLAADEIRSFASVKV